MRSPAWRMVPLLCLMFLCLLLLQGCPPRMGPYERVLGEGRLEAKTDQSVTIGGVIYEKPGNSCWEASYNLRIHGNYRLVEYYSGGSSFRYWRIVPLDAERVGPPPTGG